MMYQNTDQINGTAAHKAVDEKHYSTSSRRIQYSVFEINNSSKILNNIMAEIKNNFEKKFTQEDSVIIFVLSSSCRTVRYGYAKNEEKDFVLIQ